MSLWHRHRHPDQEKPPVLPPGHVRNVRPVNEPFEDFLDALKPVFDPALPDRHWPPPPPDD